MIKVTKITDKYNEEQNKYTMYDEVGDIVTWCEDANMDMEISVSKYDGNIDNIKGEEMKYMDGYVASLELTQKCVNKKINGDDMVHIKGSNDIDEVIKIINNLIQQMRY